jgi:hypothetical protein
VFQLLKIIAFELVDEVRNHPNHMMPGGWFSRETSIVWPPRSPDFTPLNFFFLYEESRLPGQKKLPSAAKACVRDTVATVNMTGFKTCGEVKHHLDICCIIRGPLFKRSMGINSQKSLSVPL